MKWGTFHRLLISLEAGFICVPITFLALLGCATVGSGSGYSPLHDWILQSVSALSLAAIAALWFLVCSYLAFGPRFLSQCSRLAWILTSIGCLIAVAANTMPEPIEYTPAWWFWNNFCLFGMGIYLTIPLGHLACLTFLHRNDPPSPSTDESPRASTSGT